ncbi:MAG: SAF domain-containing protein, partial [Actinobacteria bacterium]|nr:SAF domain-containing protein [Actinomycetota bacterium]
MLRRHVTGWAVVALTAIVAHGAMTQAATTRAAWAGGRTVLVLRTPVPAGRRIRAADVTTVQAPAALSPADAVGTLPGGAVAAIDLRTGTPIGASMLRVSGRLVGTDSLEPGRVAVAVRTGELPTPASVGDVVDVAAPGWDGP